MSKYKGDIADFPDEVVKWMCDQQVKQGNPRNVKVFEIYRFDDQPSGGFDFDQTKEGVSFCSAVVLDRRFDLFFEKYPKATGKPILAFDEHRFEADCAVMTGILSNPHYSVRTTEDEFATASVAQADALIEALMKGKEQ